MYMLTFRSQIEIQNLSFIHDLYNCIFLLECISRNASLKIQARLLKNDWRFEWEKTRFPIFYTVQQIFFLTTDNQLHCNKRQVTYI